LLAHDFSQYDIFQGLTDGELTSLLSNLHPVKRDFASGELLCRVRDFAETFWLLADGTVGVYFDGEMVQTRSAPFVIGEQGLLNTTTTRTAELRGLTPGHLYEIRFDALHHECTDAQKAVIWNNIAKLLSGKLEQATQRRSTLTKLVNEKTKTLNSFSNNFALTAVDALENYQDLEVVVWFSDLVGFSSAARGMTGEEIADLIKTPMQLQSDIVDQYDGYVDKFMGDGLMAFWVVRGGQQQGFEQIANKAFNAAKKCREEIQKMPLGKDGATLDLRIGLHAGNAKYGNFGSVNQTAYTLIGDDVNWAARLEQAKNSDKLDDGGDDLATIRVSATLYDKLSSENRSLLPYQTKTQAKERELLIHSGPAKNEGDV